MLRPIGSLPPTVYWRRRLMILAPLVLIAITAYVAINTGGSSKPTGAAAHTSTSAGSSSSVVSSPSTAPASTAVQSTSGSSTAATTHSSVPVSPTACAHSALSVVAVTGAPSYAVGTTPTLYLQVTNIGKLPCVENLSDRQIEMRVYNGASRVWGSHDCQIAPDTAAVTLPINQPVRRSVVWTGLSSQPACAGARQRVGAGTYTLQVYLAGVEGKTSTFTLK
jgi:hypothetical protein